MGRDGVVEGVAVDGIHHVPGMEAVGLVEDDVEDDGYALLMAGVDEVAVVVGRAVGFVGREVEVGVIAPGVVAVELHDGHELDGVDAERFEVGDAVDGLTDCAVGVGSADSAREVAEEHFVDDELRMVGHDEAFCPFIVVDVATVDGEHDVVESVVGILGHVGPDCGVEPFVAVAVEYKAGVGVGDGCDAVDEVVVGIPAVVGKARDGGPEVAVSVVIAV